MTKGFADVPTAKILYGDPTLIPSGVAIAIQLMVIFYIFPSLVTELGEAVQPRLHLVL